MLYIRGSRAESGGVALRSSLDQGREYTERTRRLGQERMLACHASQSTWLKNQYDMSYLEFIQYTSRFRGLQCGVRYAECFQVSPTWPKRCEGILLP